MDEYALSTGTDLAAVRDSGSQDVFDGAVDIGVLPDDGRGLTTEFERDICEVHPGRSHDRLARFDAPGHRDHVDGGGFDQRGTGLASASDQVANTVRQVDLLVNEFEQTERRQRRQLAGLDHEGDIVAAPKGHPNLQYGLQ